MINIAYLVVTLKLYSVVSTSKELLHFTSPYPYYSHFIYEKNGAQIDLKFKTCHADSRDHMTNNFLFCYR